MDKIMKNRDVCLNRHLLEDITVNAKEHKLLKKSWKQLEKRYNVLIRMPMSKSLDSDILFVTIQGEKSNRDYVKKFLEEKMKVSIPIESHVKDDDVVLITLSDSENESSAESEDISIINLSDDDTLQLKKELPFKEIHNESVYIIGTSTRSSYNQMPINSQTSKKRKWKNRKARSKFISCNEGKVSDSCEVTSTTNENMVSKKAKLSESVLVIEEPGTSSNPVEDFIPLQSGSKSDECKQKSNKHNKSVKKDNKNIKENSNEINNDIMIIDEPKKPRHLRPRPIVIDGSNVAMEHGKGSRTFSAKGIKLAIDFFLERGHKKVTAFIPRFRRNPNKNRAVPTTDADILYELERQQIVVCTPSRFVNGKCISSYDDRFIVKLAASNGGVIVSNDNFRDLINDSEDFKQAIEQRLLMFCFVDDVFMVPDDPLGREGPSLDDYLSFPL